MVTVVRSETNSGWALAALAIAIVVESDGALKHTYSERKKQKEEEYGGGHIAP